MDANQYESDYEEVQCIGRGNFGKPTQSNV